MFFTVYMTDLTLHFRLLSHFIFTTNMLGSYKICRLRDCETAFKQHFKSIQLTSKPWAVCSLSSPLYLLTAPQCHKYSKVPPRRHSLSLNPRVSSQFHSPASLSANLDLRGLLLPNPHLDLPQANGSIFTAQYIHFTLLLVQLEEATLHLQLGEISPQTYRLGNVGQAVFVLKRFSALLAG